MERHLPLPTGDNVYSLFFPFLFFLNFIYLSFPPFLFSFLQKEGFTKTLIPMDIGGRAGGQKYLINNILFKFAVDVHNLYGSDYAAAKAAGNEVRKDYEKKGERRENNFWLFLTLLPSSTSVSYEDSMPSSIMEIISFVSPLWP